MNTIINNTGVQPIYTHDYKHPCIYLGQFNDGSTQFDLWHEKSEANEIEFLLARYGNHRYEYNCNQRIFAEKYQYELSDPIGECYRRAMAYLANPENPRP